MTAKCVTHGYTEVATALVTVQGNSQAKGGVDSQSELPQEFRGRIIGRLGEAFGPGRGLGMTVR